MLHYLYLFSLILLIGCSSPSHYFSLTLYEDALATLKQNTAFNCSAIEASLLGVQAKKVHSVGTSSHNSTIIVLQKQGKTLAYLYPTNNHKKIARIEVLHPNITTIHHLHVGQSIEASIQKGLIHCDTNSSCQTTPYSSISYYINQDTHIIEYIQLDFLKKSHLLNIKKTNDI